MDGHSADPPPSEFLGKNSDKLSRIISNRANMNQVNNIESKNEGRLMHMYTAGPSSYCLPYYHDTGVDLCRLQNPIRNSRLRSFEWDYDKNDDSPVQLLSDNVSIAWNSTDSFR